MMRVLIQSKLNRSGYKMVISSL